MQHKIQLNLDSVLISLSIPADQPKGYLEVSDINGYGAEGENPSIPVIGLPGISHIQISSWLRESELDAVRTQNPNIHFYMGAV